MVGNTNSPITCSVSTSHSTVLHTLAWIEAGSSHMIGHAVAMSEFEASVRGKCLLLVLVAPAGVLLVHSFAAMVEVQENSCS